MAFHNAELGSKFSFEKSETSYYIIVNLVFLVVGLLWTINDQSIPFWDHKVHAQKSIELLTALKQFDVSKIFRLLASDRAPGTTFVLAPLVLLFPSNIDTLQFFTLLLYGNVFVAGCVMLAKSLWPRFPTLWFFVLPATCPLLWGLGLKPYFDVGPLALTPWVLFLAYRTQYFQIPKASALFGAVFGLEILFRSYGAYICIAFAIAYAIYYIESGFLESRPFDHRQTLKGVMISIAAFIPVALVPGVGIVYMVIADIGNASYLWGTSDNLFYLKSLLNAGLGGAVFTAGLIGIGCLAFAGSRERLLVYFTICLLLIFQFLIPNKDQRYAGALAALFTIAAAYFFTILSLKAHQRPWPKKLTAALSIAVVILLGHQLYLHLFPTSSNLHKALSRLLTYPAQPLFAYSGNQRSLLEQIATAAEVNGITAPSVYFGKDRPEFNYDYVNWLKFAEGQSSRYKGWRLLHSDVPRYHGTPVNLFDVDFIITGETASAFNSKLFENLKQNRSLLPNYELHKSLDLKFKNYEEPLRLYRRTRSMSIQEQIAFQEKVLSLDPGNIFNLEQLLWLYKVKSVNRLDSDPGSLLVAAAKIIPDNFDNGNISFENIKPYYRFLPLLPETKQPAFKSFYSKRGVLNDSEFWRLDKAAFDSRFNPDWLFMLNDRGSWVPLVAQKWRGEVWNDRKWGSLISTSRIGTDNSFFVGDKPMAIFWIAPRDGSIRFDSSISSKAGRISNGDAVVTVNDSEINGTYARDKYTFQTEIAMKKNDVLGIRLSTAGSYDVKANIRTSR